MNGNIFEITFIVAHFCCGFLTSCLLRKKHNASNRFAYALVPGVVFNTILAAVAAISSSYAWTLGLVQFLQSIPALMLFTFYLMCVFGMFGVFAGAIGALIGGFVLKPKPLLTPK